MTEDWTEIEVEVIIADYFSMLRDEFIGKTYNKSEHRRMIAPLLNNRPKGSIEFKHQNISAVLYKLGIPWIPGYKPRWNYQKMLEERIVSYLKQNDSLETHFAEFAEKDVSKPAIDVNFKSLLESPPEIKSMSAEEPGFTYQRPVKANYLEIEQNNKRLGNFGEEIVMTYERWRLIEAGKDSLADKIEWVSETQGDGLGYDVLSKNNNGTDRYIEVKTTKLGKDAPIFFSRNEYEFSVSNSNNYYLYRLFNFSKDPKLFIVNGQYDDFCRYQAVKYRGNF